MSPSLSNMTCRSATSSSDQHRRRADCIVAILLKREGKQMPADDEARERWPRFEMVKFSEPTGIPHGWDAELLRRGVPKDLLGAYQTANELTLLENRHDGQLVRFGTISVTDSICLNPHTGVIVWVVDVPGGLEWPVNSSLERFITSVSAVLNRFPFDSENARERQGQDQERGELEIDWDSVADENTFWMSFLDDVRMGDFSTKMVLDNPDE